MNSILRKNLISEIKKFILKILIVTFNSFMHILSLSNKNISKIYFILYILPKIRKYNFIKNKIIFLFHY